MSGVEALYPPGGAIEQRETPAEAAVRETHEETGLDVRVAPGTELVERYPYRWAGVMRDVTTHYFTASLVDPSRRELPIVRDAAYHRGAPLLEVSEALAALVATHEVIARAVSRLIAM